MESDHANCILRHEKQHIWRPDRIESCLLHNPPIVVELKACTSLAVLNVL